MTSKQFLEQANRLTERIRLCNASIEHYDELGSSAGAIRYDRDGSMTQRSQNAPFELPMCEKRDLEELEKKERAELWEKLKEIRYVIRQVEDSDVQDVLRWRYIVGKTIREIAAELKLSESTIKRRLEDGWHEVSLITGYPEPRLPARERHGIAKKQLREYYEEENEC